MANLQKFDERVQKLFYRDPSKKQISARIYVSSLNILNRRIKVHRIPLSRICKLTGFTLSAVSRILALCYVPRADVFVTIFQVVSFLSENPEQED